MLTTVSGQVCMNHVESSMDEFVKALEETANKKTTSKLIFRPETTCFNQSKHEMSITREQDSKVCEAKCGVPQDTCYLLTFKAEDIALAYKSKCIDIPAFTNFESDLFVCMPGEDEDNYEVIPIGEKIPFGVYILKNSNTAEWTSVCVIRDK